MSKFHFSRVFSTHMGESPSTFLWRTRLEGAALKLKYGQTTSITHTALDYGFSSPEAFSRAFARRFGIGPRHFLRATRSNRRWASSAVRDNAVSRGGLRETIVPAPGGLSVQIETIPASKVAYLRRRGPYNVYNLAQNEIGAGLATLYRLAEREGFLHNDSRLLGVSRNNPRLTSGEVCLYDICVTLHHEIPESGLVGIQTIPGGTFAVLRVTCPAPAIAAYWNWLTSQWLPASGVIRELGPSFERYPAKRDIADPRQVETEICLRVKPRRET